MTNSGLVVAGIVAEYNPFHNGHAWQIQRTRDLTNADLVVVVMSGDFVQRGAPAILDKRVRTRLALLGGADLVLELPVAYATGSAQFFAEGAVGMLSSLGCVDFLSFGSESGKIEIFQMLSDILADEPADYQSLLRGELRKGRSFPAARNAALHAFYAVHSKWQSVISGAELDAFLALPNNILGLEYCRALKALDSAIAPVTVARMGAGYHEKDLDLSFPSASGIRASILDGKEISLLEGCMPREIFDCFSLALLRQGAVFEDDFSLLLHAKLLSETPDSLAGYFDVSPDLAQRIWNRRNEFTGFCAFASLLKTREMTYTRICRALLHILLDLHHPAGPDYVRILGFRESAGPLLSTLKGSASLPLVTKLSKAEKNLSPQGIAALNENTYAANLYEAVRAGKTHTPFLHEYQKPLVIL